MPGFSTSAMVHSVPVDVGLQLFEAAVNPIFSVSAAVQFAQPAFGASKMLADWVEGETKRECREPPVRTRLGIRMVRVVLVRR